MTNTKLIWHITVYCVIAHFAMGNALANNLHVVKAEPVVGYAVYDSGMSPLYWGAE